MQLINLTTYKKNNVSNTDAIAVDVDDVITPIRFSANSKSYFTLRSKSPITEVHAVITTDYQCDETLSAIQALSSKLLILTVKEREDIDVADETYVFNAGKVCGSYVTVSGGTEFYYIEENNPQPVKYLVSESISTIMSQQAAAGGVVLPLIVAVSDETTVLTTGTEKITFRAPIAFTLTKVKASLNIASIAGGTIFTINVKKNGTTIFSTKPTIDAGETTTETAVTPSVLSTTSFADDDIITIDIDSINGGSATGLKVTFIGNQ